MGALRWCSLFFFAVLICGSAHAERRIALVVGNSSYKSVPKLANPVNDVALVGSMFRNAGFDFVDIRTDLDAVEMRKVLREFGSRVRDAEVAVLYYAGHGIELDGNNYLIPTDATLETDSDVLDETVALDRVLFAVEPAKQLRLVILDACRDNPFARAMKRTVASRAISRGLAKVEPTSPNTMIAFAAKAGSTASDGDGKNSPFALAVVERLPTPGLDLRKAFGFVRDDVLKVTNYKQEPYVYGSLGGEDVPLVPAKQGPKLDPEDAVRRHYELALQLGTRDGWSVFLSKYPEGFYAGLAKGQLNKIAAEEARAAAAEMARQAEEEKARLAAERAKKAEQDKAAAAAQAAKDARLAAEKIKDLEEAKAAEAEQRRKELEAAVAKALADRQAAEKRGSLESDQTYAALSSTTPQPDPMQFPHELATSMQSELRRVGCLADVEGGEWSAKAQQAMTLFNKYAETKFETKLPSLAALDSIKARPGRVCPLVCDRGFKADGDACVRIACRAGYRVNEQNECEKVQNRKPQATRNFSGARDAERKRSETTPPKPQASGQIICNQAGCRPVRPGCRLYRPGGAIGAGTASGTAYTNGGQSEICD